MKKILSLAILALLCNVAFSQADTTAIFQKADSLNTLGDTFFDAKKYNEAFELYNQAAEMTKDIVNGNNIHYATSLYDIAWIYSSIGDYENANKYFVQTAEIQKVILGEEHPKYAKSLLIIGSIYNKIGDYQNGVKYLIEAKDISKKIYGEEHPEYAIILNTLGVAYTYTGNYKMALKSHFLAMEIREKALGEKHPDYAASLINIANVYNSMGDYQNAKKYISKAMKIIKETLGEMNTSYGTILYNIGVIYNETGDCQTALKYFMQSLEIDNKVYGEGHPNSLSKLIAIGHAYYYMGEYQKALKHYEQALEINQRVLGIENPHAGTILTGLGNVYYSIGDHQTALKYYMQSMEIEKKIYGDEHPEYAAALNNIAIIYKDMGDYQNALKYLTQAHEIRKKIYGEEHFEIVASMNNIGLVYYEMGNCQMALNCYTRALEIRNLVIGEDHPLYAELLINTGNVYSKMGEYSDALKYCMQAMEILKNVLGNEHPASAESMHNVSDIYYSMADCPNAIKFNKYATSAYKNNLVKNFSYMTAHEREAYWDANNKYFSCNIKYMYHLPDDTLATKTSYDSELVAKGLLLASEISMTNIIMESEDSALIADYENMKLMHLQLNKELEKNIAERIYDYDSLENEIQKMERHIMEKSKEFGDVTHFIKIDWKEVQNSLKQNDVAIEFSNFTENDTTRYLALVLTKNMDAPVCVPLFTKNDIGKMLRGTAPAKPESTADNENRGATTVAAKRQGIYESTSLYNALWKPLEKYFPENPRIYFAPSGDLHQIAVEYAPTGNGKTISDKYEIYRVSSTRFLAMDYMPKPFKNSVLYGGIYYDSDTTTMKQESNRYSTRSATSYTSFADFNRNEERGSLNYLPGTKTEVEDIVGKLKKKRIKSQLYEGSQANEESFKALSGSDISVLHIATHGFFLPTDEKLSGDQSLIQSGLLLSGANYAWQNKPLPEGVEDGILTAKEISFMDLRKTDLVVLSACQTALGEITGEGVFGLQRGFKKAGARTIIMSLWPVDDNATLLMMTEFYTNLTKGMSKREAFLTAQNKVKTTVGFENPRYWAAFIMLDGNEK